MVAITTKSCKTWQACKELAQGDIQRASMATIKSLESMAQMENLS